MGSLEPVAETINFPAKEVEILEFWKEQDAFQTSVKQSEGKRR